MCLIRYAPSLLGALFVFATGTLVHADPEALWLEPSQKWYGIDGNWSAIGLFVGEPAQQVDVTVNTALSELWVVERSGCDSTNVCKTSRGNVFDAGASHSWGSLGQYKLGLDYLGGNGDYAMETVVVYDSAKRWQTSLQKQIVAGINDTQYFTGYFGLGITPGKFQDAVVMSPLADLVERVGVVPSHSYGYTAGAYYGGKSGTPISITLGGYDENRFVPHATNFNLNIDRETQVLVRGISAHVTSPDKAPTAWGSTSRTLLSFNESVKAVIDTTTPYLWLPTPVCEHFAQALGLTWNETFGLYLYSNTGIFNSFARPRPDLSFTFTLSSSDNLDNFGHPLDVPGAVNITISANAFAQTLRFPFQNLFRYGDAAIPYFPLKRHDNASRAIIGRAFMQETYMITNYETSTFSLHKALFPENPRNNVSIVTIKWDSTSPYSGPALQPGEKKEGLRTPQIIGIAVGAFVFGVASLITLLCLRRRRRKQMRSTVSELDDWKGSDTASEQAPPQTPVRRILSRITKKFSSKRNKKNGVHEVAANTNRAVEVGADINHERYELAVPPEPVELDASDAHSINGTTDFGSEDTHNLGAYEIAQVKISRQLQGPVPEYTPPSGGLSMEAGGKSHQDQSPVAHYRASDHLSPDPNPSPTSTNTNDNHTYTLPSPMTPHGVDWTGLMPDPPSPLTFIPPSSWPHANRSIPRSLPSPMSFDHRSLGRTDSSCGGSPTSPTGPLQPPPPTAQRTPIDTSRIVCLGPLPDNVRLPHQRSAPRLVGPDGLAFVMPTIPSLEEPRRDSSADSLGSNFTVEEEEQGELRLRMMESNDTREGTFGGPTPPPEFEGEPSPTSSSRLDGEDGFIHIPQPPPRTADFANRLDPRADLVHIPTPPGAPSPTTGCVDGVDLVHIPQPASRRYSWEEQ